MDNGIDDAVTDEPSEGIEIPEVPAVPDYPEVPEISDYPEETEIIEYPEVPEVTEYPEEPEVTEEPVVEEEPEEVDEAEIQTAVYTLGGMENLNPDTWDSLGQQERLETLQSIENSMAEIQGRPPVEVVLDDSLESNEFGGFNGETISINANHLNSEMPIDEFIDTIVHEGRHAYQDYAINNPGFVSDTALVNSWAENRENYLRPEEYGQEIYVNQPIEADAWNYANQIRNTLIANNWSS